MNYANMIEEKNLKKTFIISTLVSTLVGTFTSSLGLYERLNQKRQQKHVDKGQDDEIKKLRQQVEDIKNKKDEPQQQQRKSIDYRRNDDLEDSLERSGALIRREFEDNYARMGKRYAIGDTMTENQLQAQVIMLQQTVINVLQDALYNNRQPDRIDMEKLLMASDTARNNSIEALRNQYQRMLTGGGSQKPLSLPPAPSISSSPSRRSSPSPPPADSTPLFCRYSTDLQNISRQPLHPRLRHSGDLRCPACLVRLAIDPNDVWKIVKESKIRIKEPGYEKEVTEERAFHLTDRFVIKCHREDGEFACVLCNRNRKVDTVCANVETLVRHVGRVHEIDEYERDIDIREFGGP